MPTWNNISLPNSNSPIIEQLTFFHDHTIIILTIITLTIIYFITSIIINKISSRLILEGQEIETIWTIIPAIILIFIAIPSLRILYLIEESFFPRLTVKIIGHQWYWSYEITNLNIRFDSFIIPTQNINLNSFRLLDVDNRLIIPFNIRRRLLITAGDVIHSWTIPSIGVKVDAVPGRLNQILISSKLPGVFFGQCSEICGANHRFIPICLETTSIKNFFTWIKNFSLNGW